MMTVLAVVALVIVGFGGTGARAGEEGEGDASTAVGVGVRRQGQEEAARDVPCPLRQLWTVPGQGRVLLVLFG
jgi:hypothetical protein